MSSARDNNNFKLFTRRALVLGAAQAGLFSLLGGRLYYLQVVEADKYTRLADRNRFTIRWIAPKRGEITDRFGTPLAINQQNYQVSLVSEDILHRARKRDERTKVAAGILDHLNQIVPIPEADYERVLEEVAKRRSFLPIQIRDRLTWTEMAHVQVNKAALPGILLEEGPAREYPFAKTAAHLVGYVSSVSEKDLDGDPVLQLPGFRIGKEGIEKAYDKPLRGKAGERRMEVDALGRVMDQKISREAKAGAEVSLTVDIRLQEFATKRLGDEAASAVVMDIFTGEVMALVSIPAYDPNTFSRRITTAEWAEITQDTRSPLINKAIGGVYSPGSTFKMIVALAGLEAGVIDENEVIPCNGFMQLGNHRFHCWKRSGHGAMNLVSSLAHSCDIYFYEVAKRCGVDKIAAMARQFGLGETLLDIEMTGEKSGLIPTRSWKVSNKNEQWHQGDTFNVGIGQGYVLTTPLQLATMTARIANGGLKVMPTLCRQTPEQLLNGLPQPSFQTPETLDIPKAHMDIIRQGMWAVVNDRGGTARKSAIPVPDWVMAGKTATTQVRKITAAMRATGMPRHEDIPREFRDHALFVCYAPYSKPRYSCAVIVEHGGGGSSVAAPIARDIMMETLRLDPSSRKPGEEIPLEKLPSRARSILTSARTGRPQLNRGLSDDEGSR